jgi:hypothetical protein
LQQTDWRNRQAHHFPAETMATSCPRKSFFLVLCHLVFNTLGGSARIPPDLGIVVQDHVQQGIMDLEFYRSLLKRRFHESTFESATFFASASGSARNLSAHTGASAGFLPPRRSRCSELDHCTIPQNRKIKRGPVKRHKLRRQLGDAIDE